MGGNEFDFEKSYFRINEVGVIGFGYPIFYYRIWILFV